MQCQQCGSSIDYRFATTCLSCNRELAATGNDSDPVGHNDNGHIGHLKLGHHLANLAVIVVTALAGLVVGAVVTYLAGGCVYVLIYGNEVKDGYSCERGTAVGFLLLFVGAHLGSVSGGIFGFANRIYKRADSNVKG